MEERFVVRTGAKAPNVEDTETREEGVGGALEEQGVCLVVLSRYIVTTIVNIGRF